MIIFSYFSLAIYFYFKQASAEIQNVIIIGGGMAGITAARTLSNDKLNRYHVQIFEAKRDRYGGRLWTKRNLSANSKKIQADLGASLINSKVKNNPLINLTEKFEIELESLGQSQFYTSHNKKLHKGLELLEAQRQAEEIFLNAVEKAKNKKNDISVQDAVKKEIVKQGLSEESLVVQIIQSLPSFSIPDSSALLYGPDRLDFGYDKFVKFGLTEVLDRLVGGIKAEAPLDVYLRQPVRQIEVRGDKNKVVLRGGGSQKSVDAVIVAVPLSVIKNDSLLFDPKLPQNYYKLFNKLHIMHSERLVIEFDEVFWPEEIGTFQITPETPEDNGMFLMWTNLHKITNKPYLATEISNPAVEKFLKMSNEEVTELALERLKKIFGADVIRHKNVTDILRSDWSKSLHIGGSSVYPPTGNTEDLWDIFSVPLCPGLYFAGDYTVLDGLGTLHGAYNSGLRAAELLMSGFCEKQAAEETKRRQLLENEKNKNETKGESSYDEDTNESVRKDEL